MKNENINSLLSEFRLKCQEYYICLRFAARGVKESADKLKENKPDPNARLWLSNVVQNAGGEAVIKKNYASISIERYLGASQFDGAFSNEIAKAFVCTIYSLWDETYRNAIADDADVEQKRVSADLMGDLRHIRHCIIHSKSKIINEHEKIKVLAWDLNPGDLLVTERMFGNLIDQINEMPVIIRRFSSPMPLIQRFYDSLAKQEKISFDNWIERQEIGADIRGWPQWASVAERAPWLNDE